MIEKYRESNWQQTERNKTKTLSIILKRSADDNGNDQ